MWGWWSSRSNGAAVVIGIPRNRSRGSTPFVLRSVSVPESGIGLGTGRMGPRHGKTLHGAEERRHVWISTWAGVMLEDCQLTVRLPPFHGGGRRELARRPRIYGLDTRLVCHLRGWTHRRPVDRGLLWENLVLDELTAVPGPAGRDRVAAVEAKISPDAFDPKPRLDFGTPVPTDGPALLPVRDGARPSLVARHGGYCLRSLAVGATASGPAAVAAGGNWNGLFARWIR